MSSATRNQFGVTRYTYDAAHRLQHVRHPDQLVDRYEYDAADNLVVMPSVFLQGRTNGHCERLELQTGNRLRQAVGEQFEYDDSDHIVQRHRIHGTTYYRRDSLDQLVSIKERDLEFVATYDPLGRRTEKTVNGATTTYYGDVDRLSAEVSPTGQLRIYVYAEPLAMVPLLFIDYASVDADPTSGRPFYIASDHLGTVERVLDEKGETVWRARLDPYGLAHIERGQAFYQPLRFPGHFHDAETGLHYNRFRYYDPRLGRYLESDPLGIDGGINLYAYTSNPLKEVDLRGEARCGPICRLWTGLKRAVKRVLNPGTSPKDSGPRPEKAAAKRSLDAIAPRMTPEQAAKACGMQPKHVEKLRLRCMKRGQLAIIRASNPLCLQHHDNPETIAKPAYEKRKTAKSGPHAGLVVDKSGEPVRSRDGKKIHGDYDMMGVYERQPDGSFRSADTNDEAFPDEMNREVTPDKPMFHHGANDDYERRDEETDRFLGMGRNPDPDEKYLVAEPDGSMRVADGTENLKDVYDTKGIPWKYDVPPYPP